MTSKLFRILAFTASFALPCATHAENIVIGQCTALSGSLGKTGKALTMGAMAAVEATNAGGGINGQKISLLQKDDAYDVEKTVQCTQEMIKAHAVALLGYTGSGNVAELLRRNVLSEAGVPLVAPYTGGTNLREPYNPWIFHIRASYADEVHAMVEQYVHTGFKRIAVMYQNDAFGLSGLEGVQKALEQYNLKPVAAASYEKNSEDVGKAVESIAKSNPQAVILVAVTNPAAQFIKQFVPRSPGVPISAVSVVNGEDIYRIAGEDAARGIGITQVMPSPFSSTLKLIREYTDAMKRFAATEPVSYASFEAYVGARVLIAALRKAGPSPKPAAVLKALETLNTDIDGFKLAFGPNQRIGSKFIEVTLIGAGGRNLR